MGRLKKDHSGWKTHGIWEKYQQPSIVERNKHKSKKDTTKYCGGKSNKPHNLIRYFERRWISFDVMSKYKFIRCKCVICGKHFYKKRDSSIPLIIDLDNKYETSASYQIQVKVNGVVIPFKDEEEPVKYTW